MQKKGFTLIELLVATTIIILLSVVGMAFFGKSAEGARNSKRKADLESVRQALVLQRADGVQYPIGNDYNSVVSALSAGGYLSKPTPAEPKTGHAGYFYRGVGGTTFTLCARLEPLSNSTTGNSTSIDACTGGPGVYYCLCNP